MSVPIKPLSEYVVAQVEKQPTKTASGIYLPESSKEKSDLAVVCGVGSDVKEVKSGDRVVYKSYSATSVKVQGEEYLLIKEEDILATVEQ